MARRHCFPITAYGIESDVDKVTILAAGAGETISAWIVRKIRESWREAFGDSDAAHVAGYLPVNARLKRSDGRPGRRVKLETCK